MPKQEHPNVDQDILPVLAIGGLTTGPESSIWYRALLNDGSNSALSPADRFVWMPKRGLGKHSEIKKLLNEQVLRKVEKIGRKVILVGHSMGGELGGEVVMDLYALLLKKEKYRLSIHGSRLFILVL
jgi:hypothetical protein